MNMMKFIEQLDNIFKIYDLMALCASYIINHCTENIDEILLFEDENYDNIYDAINMYCFEKTEKGYMRAFSELKDYVKEFLANEITTEKCYAIVKYIDELVEVEIDTSLLEKKDIIEYSSMNKQYSDCVKIIPKLKNTLLNRGELEFLENDKSENSLFRERRKYECSVLDSFTVNYMILNKENILKYPFKIYRFNRMSIFSKYFYEKKQICFGISPFTNRGIEELFEIGYKGSAFYVDHMHKDAEMELKKRYESILVRCTQIGDIDFLIFPEMLMTEEIMSSLKGYKRLRSKPMVIVNGSIWKNKVNKTLITDDEGMKIMEYTKKEPFQYKYRGKKYIEWLDKSKNKEYSILEIEGIGRIGVAICKDLINEDVKLFHKAMDTDILIVPAYTRSMDLQTSAENMSEEYHCIVVVANACSALAGKVNGEKIGFVSLPAKNGSHRTNKVIEYTRNDCESKCEKKCLGKKILIEFCDTMAYDDGISFKISEGVF